jgi:hypothetical protein
LQETNATLAYSASPSETKKKKQHNVDTKSFEKLSFVFWMKFPAVVVVVVAARRSTTSREDKKLEEQHLDPHGRQAFISQDHSSIFFSSSRSAKQIVPLLHFRQRTSQTEITQRRVGNRYILYRRTSGGQERQFFDSKKCPKQTLRGQTQLL